MTFSCCHPTQPSFRYAEIVVFAIMGIILFAFILTTSYKYNKTFKSDMAKDMNKLLHQDQPTSKGALIMMSLICWFIAGLLLFFFIKGYGKLLI